MHPAAAARAAGRSAIAGDVEAVWGPILDREPGRDTNAILQACADREIDVLFLIGVDPLRDAPDAALARRALQNVPIKVVQSLELGRSRDVRRGVPAGGGLHREGRATSRTGKGAASGSARSGGREGISLADWEIFASLALACGGDLGFETLDELHEEMGRLLAPSTAETAARPGATATASAAPSASGLRLFTYPLLVDEGRLSERADELKAALEEPAFVEIHPGTPRRPGSPTVDEWSCARTPARPSVDARVTEHVAPGAVFVPFNQPGLAANTLLSGDLVTGVTLEAAGGGPAPAAAEPRPEVVSVGGDAP